MPMLMSTIIIIIKKTQLTLQLVIPNSNFNLMSHLMPRLLFTDNTCLVVKTFKYHFIALNAKDNYNTIIKNTINTSVFYPKLKLTPDVTPCVIPHAETNCLLILTF